MGTEIGMSIQPSIYYPYIQGQDSYFTYTLQAKDETIAKITDTKKIIGIKSGTTQGVLKKNEAERTFDITV
ncbi:MAG: hypothetical protein RR614_11495, partial [Eubacterium sp.]